MKPLAGRQGLRSSTPLERKTTPCGIVAETLAGKALSSSFVGAYAGALVIAEVAGLHGGVRCEVINGQLRSNSLLRVALREEDYQRRVAISGFTPVMSVRQAQTAAF